MYQVIARKYRPQTFADLLGQEHVQKTLANAIGSGRLAHGYIFSGQRGTGKTTVARILARCLNCIHGPTPTPCGVCSSCIEISAGSSVDVIEIDAASNRGINEMREIRENVRYRPARDKYKVFIIDEAHQITKEAFNALLKTLEEPPEWVVFILCTTEANEIPNTIASRCQHFTFRSVDFLELIGRMKHIIAQEGIEADDEVLSVIAQAGEGSVRDSLSALDQAIARCGRKLDVNEVRALLGMFGVESLRAVAEALKSSDGARMLGIVEELEQGGQSLQHFCRELSRYWRNLLVVKITGKPTRLVAASDGEQASLIETANGFSEEDLTRYLNLTLGLYKDLQYSLQPRLHLELGLIKLVQAGRLQSIEEALAQLGTGGEPTDPKPDTPTPVRAPSPQRSAAPQAPAPAPVKPAPKAVEKAPPVPEQTTAKPVQAEPAAKTSDFKQDFYQALCKAGLNFTADALQSSEVRLEGNEVLVRAPKAMMLYLKIPNLQQIASEAAGRPVRVRTEVGEGTATAAPSPPPHKPDGEDNQVRQRALSHPGVKRFQELFPEAQVRAVRNLNE